MDMLHHNSEPQTAPSNLRQTLETDLFDHDNLPADGTAQSNPSSGIYRERGLGFE